MNARLGKKLALIILALGIVLMSSGFAYALTPTILHNTSWSKFNRNFGLWTVTNQSDFQAGVLSNVNTTTSPGNVSIAARSNWLAGYSYRKSITVNHTDDGAQTNYQMKLTIVKGVGTTIQTFNSTPVSGNWTVPAGVTSVQVLVVAGGGGGGSSAGYSYSCGGGGGAGGLIYKGSYTVTPGVNFSVIVGAGGAGGAASGNNPGINGSNSSFGNPTYGYINASGGGGGGYGAGNGLNGGSGGGSGVRTNNNASSVGTGIVGQGKNSAFGYQDGTSNHNAGGGGGGNGSVGGAGGSQIGGNGGSGGDYSAIFGTGFNASGVFAGGGGGGAYYPSTGGSAGSGGGGAGAGANHASNGAAGGNAISNTGGGGGGGASGSGSSSGGSGGNGGSGIVIISYLSPDSGDTVNLNNEALNWPNDVRFTNSDGTTLLDYWIESNTSTTATVWVEFDAIPAHPANGLFYMYYGKAGDTDASNGPNTWIFFDNASINGTANYTLRDLYTSGGTHATLTWANSSYGYKIDITSSDTVMAEINTLAAGGAYRIRAQRLVSLMANTQTGFCVRYTTSGDYWLRTVFSSPIKQIRITKEPSPPNTGITDLTSSSYSGNYTDGTWYWEEGCALGTTLTFWTGFENKTITITDASYTTGTWGIEAGYDSTVDHYFKNVCVGKYTLNEPTWGTWGSKETCYPAWTWQVPITINNVGSGLSDYQIMVNVSYNSSMQTNFNDIRFASSDGITLLPCWCENYSASNWAVFWVKAPSVPSGSSTIYMYFGNAEVGSASDGPSTFIFFDDFSGDLSKWTKENNGDNISISSGYLNCSGGTTTSPYGYTALGSSASYTNFADGVIDGKVYLTTDSIAEVGYRGNYAANTGYKSRMDARTSQGIGQLIWPYTGWDFISIGGGPSGTAIPSGTWYNFSIAVSGSSLSINCAGQTLTGTNTSYTGPGEISLQNHYGSYSLFDDIRVRKYASPEPTTSVGTKVSCTINGLVSSTLASIVFNTIKVGARCDLISWDKSLPTGTSITFEVRTSNTLFNKSDLFSPTWQSYSMIPVINGTYHQWRATLSTNNSSVTPVLNEVRDLYSW